MEQMLRKLFDMILESRTRRVIALALAIVVTFTTTYSLVLPAITLEKDSAETMSGVSMGRNEQEGDTSTSSDGEESEESDSEGGDADTVAFDAEAKNEDGETETFVHVEADADTFPEGTTMEASVVSDQDVIDSITESAEGEVVAIHAVDLTFTDENGETVQPAEGSQVSVTLSAGEGETSDTLKKETAADSNDKTNQESASEPSARAEEGSRNETADEQNTEQQATETTVVQYTEDNGAEPVETSDEVSFQVEPENDLDQDNAVSFDMSEQTEDQDSQTYAIVETVNESDEADHDREAENAGTEAAEQGSGGTAPTAEPSRDGQETLEEDPASAEEVVPGDASGSVIEQIPQMAEESEELMLVCMEATTDDEEEPVTVRAEFMSNVFPEDIQLSVQTVEMETEETDAAIEAAAGTEAAESAGVQVRALDITFFVLNEEGEPVEVEPQGEVKISMQAAFLEKSTAAEVVHVDDEGNNTLMETETDEETQEVTLTTESFSVYVVVYTVDFHFKDYTFSIEGGDTVKLSELLQALEIPVEMEQVKDVTFTDPSLVEVSFHPPVFGTVGEWTLKSLAPFLTEETLHIELKDGTSLEIVVTDAQITREVITADGETYNITVTYDENAGIPENAELRVSELTEADEGYQTYYDQTMEKLGSAVPAAADPADAPEEPAVIENAQDTAGLQSMDEAQAADEIPEAQDIQTEEAPGAEGIQTEEPPRYARFFDIEIWADGEKVEPQGEVLVTIELADTPEDETLVPSVVHFAKNGPEEMELKGDGIQFVTDEFSVYGVVYTVDFHYGDHAFSIQGGSSISLSELFRILEVEFTVADVESVTFSDEDLVKVIHITEDISAGELKAGLGLTPEYSDETTDEQIAAWDAKEYKAPDWVLFSLGAFDTEETLTVTMKDGEQLVIQVTDAHEIPDSSSATIDVNKSYLICYEADGHYYLLKNDGSVDASRTPANFENLNSTYCWTFNYVFEEKHLDETLTYTYYLIRPIDNKTKTIALNAEGEPLVQRSNNNVAVVPAEGGGFHLIGYNEVKLNFENGAFFADQLPVNDNGITVHIYEMDTLPTYSYTARSADEERGTVTIDGGTPKTETLDDGTVIHYYEAESNSDKLNAGTITATPVNHEDVEGNNKWLFDHWTQDGIALDRDQYTDTINVNTLPIPFNGSNLVAYFKQNPDYIVPDDEKLASSFEDLTNWINELKENHVPLDEEATVKTAEVYDYENRIYRVDIESKANFLTFNGDVDMAFCMDVSNSMYFPSSLVEADTNYSNNTNPIPIYRINNSSQNKRWLDQSRNWDNPYYLIADQANTATVFKVYYQNGNWKAQDASRTYESDRSFNIGDSFTTNWAGTGTHPFNSGDNDNTTYTIYNAGDSGRNRFYYLNQAYMGATSDLSEIKNILAVAGDKSPDVRFAYNTFNLNLGSQRQDFDTVEPVTGLDLSNSHGGGTRPDQAFRDALSFDWQGDDKYVILITDGAPQGQRDGESDNDFDRISTEVMTQAQSLKDSGVKLITIGLSLDKVPHGKKLLYDLADEDKNGEKMFFMAENASELPNILRHVTKTIMEHAIVYADVTDTVGEAFYPVDKESGLPLQPGEMIDIEGRKTDDVAQAAGIVQEDGRTIKWVNTAIDPVNGWHGALFVKAKEDYLGGNAVQTNGSAEILAKGYRTGDADYDFDQSLLGDKLKSLEIDFDSPRVNVNELTFPSESTEWTVYLGTQVDPEEQLKKLYEGILVTEVVNEDGSLYYPIEPNSIVDDRTGGESGTAQTFALAPLILDLIKEDHDLADLYVRNDELDWDAFLAAIQQPGGVVVPYHVYGTEGEDSNITITLTREGDSAALAEHPTTAVNGTNDDGDSVPAEKYVLTVQYNPDYDHVLPAGQGGHGNYQFGTGTYGAMYQGHAAGRETSTNTHVVNVYNVPLDVYKTDGNNEPLAGAVFKLYKVDETNGSHISALDSSHKYVEVAAATSGADGIARLKHNNEDFGLVLGETYYLIEAEAPENYTKLSTVWAVEVQTEIGKFTGLDGQPIYSTIDPAPSENPPVTAGTGVTPDMYPFNWDQGARVVLDGKDPVTVIVKGAAEGETETAPAGSFVSHKDAVSFRHTVKNLGGETGITVNKTWDDNNDPNRPDSITVTLYRVSDKDHLWGEGKVVPCTCTEEGVEEYTCSVCSKTDTHAISAAGHTAGTAHQENYHAPTCTEAGCYDTVVRCTVCNAVISSEHTDIPATGHRWVNQEVETSDPENYCYDTADVCSVCNAVNEETRERHDHDWGEWQVTTPAQPGVAGVETRVCNRDPSHTETRPIDPLPNRTSITYRLYKYWVNNYYTKIGDDVTTSEQYEIGSTITISWADSNYYDAVLYKDQNPVGRDWYGIAYYDFRNMQGSNVSREGEWWW